jgi:hypothetical protein
MTGYSAAIEADADHYFASTEMKATYAMGFTADCVFSVQETTDS